MVQLPVPPAGSRVPLRLAEKVCSHFVTWRARVDGRGPAAHPFRLQAMSTTLLLEAFLAFFSASMCLWLLRLSRSTRPVP